MGISHYCQVASGRKMGSKDIDQVCENVRQITEHTDLAPCVSLGLLTKEDLLRLKAAGVEYEVTADFKGKIAEADAIYMTRLQDEWGELSGDQKAAYRPEDYFFTGEDLKVLKREGIIMHPLPRRKEISTDCDNDSRAVYWRQMRNGMWIRAALIATTFCRDDEITQYYMLNNR